MIALTCPCCGTDFVSANMEALVHRLLMHFAARDVSPVQFPLAGLVRKTPTVMEPVAPKRLGRPPGSRTKIRPTPPPGQMNGTYRRRLLLHPKPGRVHVHEPTPYFPAVEPPEPEPPKHPRTPTRQLAKLVGSEVDAHAGPNSYPVPWSWTDIYRHQPSKLTYTPTGARGEDVFFMPRWFRDGGI